MSITEFYKTNEFSELRLKGSLEQKSKDLSKLEQTYQWGLKRFQTELMDGAIDPSEIPDNLGLHRIYFSQWEASHFVGIIWLRDENGKEVDCLEVSPKRSGDDFLEVDYMKMLRECLMDPRVSVNMDACIHIWPDQPDIPIKGSRYIRLFVVTVYLHALAQLCRRHLRADFRTVQTNLTGKVKGRILIPSHLLSNVVRGRADRFYCRYMVHQLDNHENQILRAALEQSLRCLRTEMQSIPLGNVWSWSGEAMASLGQVTLRRINPVEHNHVNTGGLKKSYRRPLKLAQIVLRLLGSDPHGELKTSVTPPFALDMNELFERYCEALLRTSSKYKWIWAGYSSKQNNLGSLKVRPDFLGLDKDNKPTVLDSKYKYDWSPKTHRADLYQILAYTRICGVRDKCCKHINESEYPQKVIILYPSLDGNSKSRELQAFDQPFPHELQSPRLYTCQISLPVKPIDHS